MVGVLSREGRHAAQVAYEPDGSWRIAVAGRDPGVPNRVSTAGPPDRGSAGRDHPQPLPDAAAQVCAAPTRGYHSWPEGRHRSARLRTPLGGAPERLARRRRRAGDHASRRARSWTCASTNSWPIRWTLRSHQEFFGVPNERRTDRSTSDRRRNRARRSGIVAESPQAKGVSDRRAERGHYRQGVAVRLNGTPLRAR
jgi:hypothetical protein